jgi:mono/diheme cytochrome c family protein
MFGKLLKWSWVTFWMAPGSLFGAVAEPSADAIAKLPPAASASVDFGRDIRPILEASCVKCHGRGKAKGDWKLDTRESFLQTGESGPSVVVGKSSASHLVHLVAGTDPDDVMPKKGSKLTPAQVGLVRAWIDQGMKWDPEVTFAKPPPNNLKPRQPEVPPGTAENPIDRFLAVYFKAHGATPAPPVEDRIFARRVYLDSIGLLPTPEEMDSFLKDAAPDKRARLVQTLLGDRQRYAQHWLTFWNDLLRNDYRGTGYIDGGRKQLSRWLYAALRDNKPYDQMVRELVNPTPASEGFTKGIVWRGVVNASMTPPMQAAQNISQVLMGVNLKCASCHDSFIDDWQLSDSYGLAGIYAESSLEMVLCDKPTGKFAPLRFLYPELGSVDAKAPRTNRLEQLSRLITSAENGRLSRTIVNRLWARLFGRGLVEPMDVMQNVAWNPDILDWLAENLVAHQWDLKRTMAQILTSAAYQLPAIRTTEKPEAEYTFAGPLVRRLSAEQFRDALGSLTGIWQDKPEGDLDELLLEPGAPRVLAADALWVWGDAHGASGVPPGTNWFRKTFVLEGTPTDATFFVLADNSARLFVNGQRPPGADGPDWTRPGVYDARKLLHTGTNVVAVEAVNGGDAANPAGLLVYAKVRRQSKTTGADSAKPAEQIWDFATDASWKVSTNKVEHWKDAGVGEDWAAASVLGPVDMAPWSSGTALASAVSGETVYGKVRASLTAADPLALALGRPNREQVTTTRQSLATTMQALELTNGETLANLLRRAADQLAAGDSDAKLLTRLLFKRAFGRNPTATEESLAAELIGSQSRRDGVEDLLWSMTMLPEFQFTF